MAANYGAGGSNGTGKREGAGGLFGCAVWKQLCFQLCIGPAMEGAAAPAERPPAGIGMEERTCTVTEASETAAQTLLMPADRKVSRHLHLILKGVSCAIVDVVALGSAAPPR